MPFVYGGLHIQISIVNNVIFLSPVLSMPTQLVMGVYVEYWILGLHYNLVTWLLSRLIYIVFVLEVKLLILSIYFTMDF